jgi:hypothetical protein
MKLFLLAAAAAVMTLPAADLGEFKTVYLLPMSNGLDQFLAIKITSAAVMQVVTDPKKADAILTDHIGTSFEQKMDELFGKKDKDDDSSKTGMMNASRGRGAIFLVDRKTRDVIWSAYERPKSTAPDDLSHTADKIAQKLEKDRKGK